ncbi:MAG: hypothetical protein NC341_05080 [Blautia sp.]|nr:hypothetical protein [Blautia sp.]MCM1199680.1 hypothetical protein [Bacteroides fragilis]
MERDFEQEFRALKQSEIPDLWNRIEAGLSEKKSAAPAPEQTEIHDNGKSDVRRRFAWRKWGTLIAACLCVIIVFPAFALFIGNKSGGKDTASGAAAEETAFDSTVPEESAEGMAGAADAGGYDMAASVAEMPAAEEMPVAESTDEMSAAAEDTASSADRDAGAENSAEASSDKTVENAEIQKDEEEKAIGDDLVDGQILKEAVVQIQKVETTGGEAFYQAVILQADADAVLERETQIALVCGDDTEYDTPRGLRDERALEEQETYRVTLRYDAEDGRFVVLAAGEEKDDAEKRQRSD